jgi:hypothetical protein
MKPKPELILRYPTKYNAGKITYKNKSGDCYNYSYKETECPIDKKLIKDQPIEPFSQI